MTENEEIKKVIFGLQFLKEKLYNGIFSDRLDCIDYAISAIKELQMYKDNKLCLVPEDVYSRQCCELDAYKEIGTVEECREAVETGNFILAKVLDVFGDKRFVKEGYVIMSIRPCRIKEVDWDYAPWYSEMEQEDAK